MDKLCGIKAYQGQQKKDTMEKVDSALKNLKRSHVKITYKVVAEKAGISEQTLYKNEIFKEKIKQAKAIQDYHNGMEGNDKPQRFLSEKDKKIQRLEEALEISKQKIAEQKHINSLLLGNLEKKANENLEMKLLVKALNNVKDIK